MLIFFLVVFPAFMPKIKTGRMVQLESLCDFTDAEELQDNTRSATILYCKKQMIMFLPVLLGVSKM